MAPEETAAWWAFAARALLGARSETLMEAASELAPLPELPRPADLRAALAGDPLELEREYVRLFLHPDGAPCPPWQSLWEAEPQLVGEAHRRALAWFRRAGIEPRAEGEPADHAGLLMAFWAGSLLEQDSEAERALFFREHLSWLDRLSACIASHARHRFYQLLAATLWGLVAGTGPAPGGDSIEPGLS